MKELKSKVLDNFIANNSKKIHKHFNYGLFQDICHRLSIPSAYSRYLNDRYQFQDRSHDVKDPDEKVNNDIDKDKG